MKKLSIRLVAVMAGLTVCFTAYCQAEDDLHERMRYVFGQVDTARITTNLLYDYGYTLNDVKAYDGAAGNTAATDYMGWQGLYASLYTMQFSRQTMEEPATVHSRIMQSSVAVTDSLGSYDPSSPVTMPVLSYAYQALQDDAVSSGYVEIVDDQIRHRIGVPFDLRYAVAMAPRRSMLRGSRQRLVFVDSLYFSNMDGAMPTLSVDAGSGQGWRAAAWNQAVQVYYGTEGIKDIRLRLTYADGTVREAYTQLQITDIPDVAKRTTTGRYTGRPRETNTFGLLGDGAEVTVVYANDAAEMHKPLIVVEGFDAWHLITPDDPNQNYDVNNFLNGLNNGGIAFEANVELTGQRLSDYLEENNYDIVFVDWHDGTRPYSFNSNVLLEVIRWVNGRKALAGSTEGNVLMGLSMGGITAAAALILADTEGYDDETTLFISNDVPWQGANVPVSFQLGLKHVAGLKLRVGGIFGLFGKKLMIRDLVPQVGLAMTVAETGAAQSLLRYQAGGQGDHVSLLDRPDGDPNLEFIRNYDFIDPAETRMVALSNGYECGEQLPFAAGTTLLALSGEYTIPYLWNLLGTALTPFTGRPDLFVLGAVTTKSDLKWDIKLNALPDDGPARIYRNKVWFDKKILGLIPISQNFTEVNINSTAGMLPLDNAPGGTYGLNNLDTQIPEEVLELLPVRNFSFVPTVSALNVQAQSGDRPGREALYLRYNGGEAALPQGLMTPMDNYITENVTNQPHLLLSQTKGRWLADELEGTGYGQPCAGNCNWRPVITVPGRVCSGENVTVSVNNPFGYPVSWVVGAGLQVVSADGDFITVRPPADVTNVSYEVAARLDAGECGTYRTPVAALPVATLSQQAADGTLQGNTSLYVGSESTFYVNDLSNVDSYEWIVPAGWQVQSPGWKAYITPTGTGPARITVNMRSDCNFVTAYLDVCVGGSGYSCPGGNEPCGTALNPEPCGPGGGPGDPTGRSTLPLYYPNPASGQVTISLPAAENQSGRASYRVEIRDMRRKKLLAASSKDPQFTADISHIPAGLYIIELSWPGGHASEQLVVEK
ncbi:MAG: T9SS type A sorting domain-containing protein [Cyclobacteriaceae bacterium]